MENHFQETMVKTSLWIARYNGHVLPHLMAMD
jgi:hypothetical protein